MTTRWMLAAGAALALALTTIPFGADMTVDVPLMASDEAAPTGACEADPEPANFDFTLMDVNGNDVPLADYKGNVVILDFWATWCGPCKVEIPSFVEMVDEFGDEGLVVLGVSVDDTIEQLEPFIEEYKMNYPVLVGRDREDVQEAYGPLWGIPVTFVIGRDGNICSKHMGMTSKEQFLKEIAELL